MSIQCTKCGKEISVADIECGMEHKCPETLEDKMNNEMTISEMVRLLYHIRASHAMYHRDSIDIIIKALESQPAQVTRKVLKSWVIEWDEKNRNERWKYSGLDMLCHFCEDHGLLQEAVKVKKYIFDNGFARTKEHFTEVEMGDNYKSTGWEKDLSTEILE